MNSEDIFNKLEHVTNETLEELDKVHGPYWKSRNDLAKLIITVSAGILALTTTFASNIPSESIAFAFIVAEWFFLIMSVSASMGSLWYTMQITAVRVHFVNQGPEIKEQIGITFKHDPSEAEKEVFGKLATGPFKSLGKNDAKAWLLLRFGMASFVISLILLFAVGVAKYGFL